MSASISGSFDFGHEFSGGGVKDAPELTEELPTAFIWLTIGWQTQAAAFVEEVLSCGTTGADTFESCGAHTSCDVKVGD